MFLLFCCDLMVLLAFWLFLSDFSVIFGVCCVLLLFWRILRILDVFGGFGVICGFGVCFANFGVYDLSFGGLCRFDWLFSWVWGFVEIVNFRFVAVYVLSFLFGLLCVFAE